MPDPLPNSSSSGSLKRPRGLLKSKKTGNSGHDDAAPASKKQKYADPSEEVAVEEAGDAVSFEDWEDLKELFCNALEALKGPDPRASAPILRGVMHECDRFNRSLLEPTSVYTQPKQHERSSTKSSPDSPLAFATIQGCSLYHIGTLIREDPSIAVKGEPDDPLLYFEIAADTFQRARERWHEVAKELTTDPWQVRMEIAWGDAINGMGADVEEEEEDHPSSEPMADKNKPIEAVSHFFAALDYLPSSRPSLPASDPESDLDLSICLSREAAISEIGRGVIEATYREDDEGIVRTWCHRLIELLAGRRSNSGDVNGDAETEQLVAFDVVLGKAWLTSGALVAERCASADDYPDSLETGDASSARDELEKAAECLKTAHSHLKDRTASDTYQEVERLMGEAYLHLGNITLDEAKRESLYDLAKGLGIDVDAGAEELSSEGEGDGEEED